MDVDKRNTSQIANQEKRQIILTPAQKEAVESNDRFIAVVAGPGSGKTRVLTERICHLIKDCGVDCKSILAVSFSSKAAGEVSKRLRESLGARATGMNVCTFHSFGLSMIREYGFLLGFRENIEILTPTEKNKILKKIWDDEKKRNIYYSMPFPELISSIGIYKGGLQDVNREVINFTNLYNQALKQANCVDFDDMILLARKLLMENDDIRLRYQKQFQHIMVDEVQDMNTYQTDIIQHLVGPNTSLLIVGDDDQCIYEWRGATPDFLKNIARDANYHVVHLDDNFRSEGAIVRASSSFIQRNINRIRKNLQAKKHGQQPITKATTYAYRFGGIKEESSFIGKTIQQLVTDSMYQYKDFTILVRKHSQEAPIVEALSALEIPYHIQSDDVCQFDEFLFFLKAFANMGSKGNMSRAINYPTRIIDNFTFEDLIDEHPQLKTKSIPDAFLWLHENNCEFEDSALFHSRYEFLLKLSRSLPEMSIVEIVKTIYQHYVEDERPSAKTKEKLEKIKSILPIAEDYDAIHNKITNNGVLSDFLDCLSLRSQDESGDATDENNVNIMTCHHSKGLEFPVVFIPGVQVSQSKEMQPYSFVSGYFTSSDDLLEAERRLFYVAMTRAIDRLYITCSSDPYIGNGKTVKRGFLAEIPEIVLCTGDERTNQKQYQSLGNEQISHGYAGIDYEDINDIASSEGFIIDEDGHWIPKESLPGYDEY